MLATNLGPFRKLVLAAGGVELAADLEVLSLCLALFSGSLGGRDGEVVDGCPNLHFALLLALVPRICRVARGL